MEKIMSHIKEAKVLLKPIAGDLYISETANNLKQRVLAVSGLNISISILEKLVEKREDLYLNSEIDADIEIFATDSRNPEVPSGLALVWKKDGKEHYEVYYA
jgi:hypothetical protein